MTPRKCKKKRKKQLLPLFLIARSHHPSRFGSLGGSLYTDPVRSACCQLCVTAPLWFRTRRAQDVTMPQRMQLLASYLILQRIQAETQPELQETSQTNKPLMETQNFTHGQVSGNETLIQPSQDSGGSSGIAVPIFMFAGGAIGNLIAIVVLSVSRQGRKTSAFYTLLCGLAVTDLLGTCLASPLTIANYLDLHVLTDHHLCEFLSFVLLFFGVTGLSIICAMAAERYLAICCPYTYQRWGVDRRFAQKLLLFICISHILFCCLPMMGMARTELQPSRTWCFIDWRTQAHPAAVYSIMYGAVSMLLILGTIVLNLAVCGALILMRQRTVQHPVTRASVRDRWRELSSAAETQMITVLMMTSVAVLACSAPLVVRLLANHVMQEIDYKADLTAIRIASVNPILDPWIYILLRRSLFRRLLSYSKRLGSSSRNSPPTPQRHLLYLEIRRDSHVFGQLLCNANIITQLPATAKFTPRDTDTESLQHTVHTAD
ncbi:prostaglandin E2 receptor EP4 subtype-like [Genypterus blacodes]|uniref:prostaglandin E2 receptor EP4 subtype-like n=1 Tax=Genypterus blacodes TaxID=154954 RepID=UPI003F770FEB